MTERVRYYKLILIGDGAVGKTSLRSRFFGEGFNSSYMMTIGADFAVKRTTLDEEEYILHFWDLAGQPRFKEVREAYYKNADAAILVFDLSRPDTFEQLPQWITEMVENIKKDINDIPMVLVGNKVDLRGEPNVKIITFQEGQDYCQRLGVWLGRKVDYFETSAKVDLNIGVAFNNVIKQLNPIH
ncbi:MAG: Transforming protein p29 precursor [Candidatus Heimdallarchaeota archaeon LC_2]|nr:MAG: Transforming protein p29 precursor [Candidatus Heimdallarchaeota archaeon LC_2]